MSPFDADRVLVAGDMLGVGLSTDGGASWSATSGFSSWEINDFTWSPVSVDTVWVGTMSGPYESTDGGRTWISKRRGLPTGDYPYSAPVQKVLVDPAHPDHLLAFGGNQRLFKSAGSGALNYGNVYESLDGGETWSLLSVVGTDQNIVDAAYGGHSFATLYVAVLDHGVLRSTDGGKTWTQADAGLPYETVRDLAVDPTDPLRAWAALAHSPSAIDGVYRPGGIFQTVDGGRSWTPVNNGLPQNASADGSKATSMLSIHRASDGTLYTADQGYLSQSRFRSLDGGNSWVRVDATLEKFYPASSAPFAWATSADGRRVLAGTTDSIMESEDRGLTWTDAGARRVDGSQAWRGTGFSGLLGTRVTFSPTRPGLVLLTAFDAGNVLRSTDGGTSWTRPVRAWDNYGGGYDVASGGATGDAAYAVLGQAGSFNGVAVSRDAGATWTVRVGNGLPARYSRGANQGSIAVGSADGAVAYAVLPDGNLYVTTDFGGSWQRETLGSPARAVAASPEQSLVWVSTDAGVMERRPDGSWATLAGSPRGLRRLVPSPKGLMGVGSSAIGALSAGLWRLEAGAWNQLVRDKWISDVAVDPHDAETIAYVTNDNPYHDVSFATGVWVSRDGGVSFSQDNAGLAMTRALSIAFDPRMPGRMVIGTNGRGYWATTLPASAK